MTQATLGRFTEWRLIHEAAPWSINAERSFRHWSQRDALVKEWKRAFWALARRERIPACNRIAVTVVPHGVRQDVANCLPAAKAAIDGLVMARVVPNDTPRYVVEIRFKAPVEGRPALELVVRGEHL